VLPALLLASLLIQDSSSIVARPTVLGARTVAIDEVLAERANLRVGDTLSLSAQPETAGETVIVGAIVRRGADPSEVSRGDLRIRLHLDQLQALSGYGDRVDRFAVQTRSSADVPSLIDRINGVAFGFRAYRSRDIAVETSRTFQVVSRFHRAIGLITIVASSVFLLCIMVLKVDERRKDIAALRLMGISRSTVVRSVVVESALVALLGSALGVVLGWAISLIVNWHYQALYRTPLQFSVLTAPVVIWSVSLSLALGIGAGLLASLRLVRIPPLQLFGR
jgi:putative ABC transport system permease protein